MTRQVYREIAEAAADLGRATDVNAVIVFGGHEIFSAGDDVPELRTLNPTKPRRRRCADGRSTPWPRSPSRRSPRSPATRWAAG